MRSGAVRITRHCLRALSQLTRFGDLPVRILAGRDDFTVCQLGCRYDLPLGSGDPG